MIKITAEQVDELFGLITNINFMIEKKWILIKKEDKEFQSYFEEEPLDQNLLEDLDGYKFKVKQFGEHSHDGQMVDYTLKFKSPLGVKTNIETSMCLVKGFDYPTNEVIN